MVTYIEPYNPSWPLEFEKIKEVIAQALADLDIDVQHVGSTAIPGLCAKPMLDIDIIIEHKHLLQDLVTRLVKLGYISKGEQGIPGRFAFKQSSDFTPHTTENYTWQAHHLYVCYADSLALKNHVLFRDTLRNHPEVVQQYASVKMELVDELQLTREEYTVKKTDFILSVLSAAGLNEEDLAAIKKANL